MNAIPPPRKVKMHKKCTLVHKLRSKNHPNKHFTAPRGPRAFNLLFSWFHWKKSSFFFFANPLSKEKKKKTQKYKKNTNRGLCVTWQPCKYYLYSYMRLLQSFFQLLVAVNQIKLKILMQSIHLQKKLQEYPKKYHKQCCLIFLCFFIFFTIFFYWS